MTDLGIPDGWVLMPRELTEAWATYAQGAFMDHSRSAVECFAARYAELIAVTELARQQLLADLARGAASG